MTQTEARIKKDGKNFVILVDLDEALKLRKGEGSSVGEAVLTEYVFYNIKSGEHASGEDMKKAFGTDDFNEVCEKIIKDGEVVLPAEYLRQEQEKKYKQVVDFLVKNAVDPSGKPITPDRIMTALEEAHVNVKNKPIDEQVGEIIDQLRRVLPLKVEVKRVKLTIPAQHTGKAYGIVKEYIEKEEWKGNGDLDVIVAVPSGLIFDFYDELNDVTHGSVLSEEIKE